MQDAKKTKGPVARRGPVHSGSLDYGADEDDAGAIVLVSTEDEAVIGVAGTDELAGAIVLLSTEDEVAIGAAELDGAGAADDDGAGAADEEAATDELAVFTVVVVEPPRLKIQIRPMITITATMMIIQVLRFMRGTLGWWN